MKLLSLIFLFFIAATSCNNKIEAIVERLAVADSAAINFYKGDGNIDSVVAVKIIRDKKQLEQLTGFISSGSTDNAKCGYDGSIHFFKNNIVLQDIDFRMNDANCMYFRLSVEGKLYRTKLSAAAKEFLEKQKADSAK